MQTPGRGGEPNVSLKLSPDQTSSPSAASCSQRADRLAPADAPSTHCFVYKFTNNLPPSPPAVFTDFITLREPS